MSDTDTDTEAIDALWDETRVRTPTVLQMEAAECGAASLAMVLGYYGRYVPLEELRGECGVSRDGSKASKLLIAARKYGLDAHGYRKEMEGLRECRLPSILFWNFNHFVVFEGIRRGKAYINDPGRGPRVMSVEELDHSFTGVVLDFEPGPEFRTGGRKPSFFGSLLRRLEHSRTALVYVILSCLFLVIPGLAIPTFSRVFVDHILIGNMTGWFKPLLIGMAAALVLNAVLTWLQQYYLLRLETKMTLAETARFFRHVFRLPIEFFGQRMSGEIAGRLALNEKVARLLSGELATNLLNLFTLFFFFVVMLRYDVLLTLIGVAMVLVNLAALRLVSEKRKILNQGLQQESGKLEGIATSGLQMIETMKATGAESDFFARWSGQQAKVLNGRQALAIPTQMLSIVPPLMTSLNTVAILVVGGFRVMDGVLTIGMLVAFQGLMSSFTAPITQLVNLGSRFQETAADLNRLDDVFQQPQDRRFRPDRPVEHPALAGRAELTGALELRNVSFGYSRLEAPLIEDFSLKLSPGARVAVVGASGSGKSTVSKLIAGLYAPWSGEILFDGVPRDEIPAPLIHNSISMVDQDIFLFAGTVLENLSMWDSMVPESEIIQAAKDACIHDDISRRPGGYSNRITEGGTNLSGGQRQRLELGRALVNSPTILVLDEATSALDPMTEKIVDDNLRRRGCTCVIVAHRLSTIRDCDEIIVLDRGKVVQRGTHEELKEQDGPYAELIRVQ